MAIVENVAVLEHQIFKQRDARDPLGVWVIRHTVVGDASAGSIKIGFEVSGVQSSGRIYNCISLTIADVSGGAANGLDLKLRLLTNFPPGDPTGGTGGYGLTRIGSAAFRVNTGFTAPFGAGNNNILIGAHEDKILLFGPQPSQSEVNITEMELPENVLNNEYSFEGYGYFWDRAVLQAPGGPRFPGSD